MSCPTSASPWRPSPAGRSCASSWTSWRQPASTAVVADGYRREQIEGFFGPAYRGMAIEYSPEETPLFTGGAVKRGLSRCESDWVFVLNGNTWLDVDFAAMEAAGAR